MNDWFSAFTRLVKGSKARADAVNALFDQVETGMDKMPTEVQMNSGTRNYFTDTGAVNAYVCTAAHISGAYADGQEVKIKVGTTNTGASTLNVSGIGAATIKRQDGTDPIIGDINGITHVIYNATNSVWVLISNQIDTSISVSPISGTWVPVLKDISDVEATAGYNARYSLVGNICLVRFQLVPSDLTGMSGALKVTGFPLQVAATPGFHLFTMSQASGLPVVADATLWGGYMNTSEEIFLHKGVVGSGTESLTVSDIDASCNMHFTGIVELE